MATVGVIGAGTMGAGVAHDLARHGYDVVLVDSPEALGRAAAACRDLCRLEKLFGREAGGVEVATVVRRIRRVVDIHALEAVAFVIENVTERWDVKASVYRQLDRLCRPDAIVAANTSAIPITRLAAETSRPAQIIGIHFMNPVFLKPVVEVIRGADTSDDTVARALALLATIGKTGILVGDAPGFVSNRVLMLTLNEAIWLVHDRVAPAEVVDRVFRDCVGHKMGPLETADLIGLDTVLLSIEVLHEHLGDHKFTPCPLLREMVDAGRLGRKTGEGFFTYADASCGTATGTGVDGHY
ncbi:MAG: 3-hydroxyacyl-CoA dehydrogenase family protein [Acidobacteria bacterium]|nr:3-hydroxyacyl-CoA dehydrogenase family protein [Acidobacteriota bacterium]